jgi:hypothetical protein
MYRRTTFGILAAGLLTALVLGAGAYRPQEVSTMLFAGTKSVAPKPIPPMDKKSPAKLETATFALG